MFRKIFLALLFAAALSPARAQLGRGEFQIAGGVAPVTNWVDAYDDFFSEPVPVANARAEGWGALSVGCDFLLFGKVGLGARVVYSSNRQSVYHTDSRIRNRHWSVMPGVRWNWLNFRRVGFYSRLGAGVVFGKSSFGERSQSRVQFAFQVSPVGVEVGGRLALFAEAGIGMAGCLLIGGRCRF